MGSECMEGSAFSLNFNGTGRIASRCWVQNKNGVLYWCCYVGGTIFCSDPMFNMDEIRTEPPPDPDAELYKDCS